MTKNPTSAPANPSRFTEWLKQQTQPAWDTAVSHRFTEQLGEATLDTTVFKTYLVQDYAFINTLVSAFGFAVGQAPTIDAKRRHIQFLDTLTDEENTYFERSFNELDVPRETFENPSLAPVTKSFIDLLGRATREGGYAETLGVLVPAEWIYNEWATSICEVPDSPFYFREWIELHDNEPFNEFVTWLRFELDTLGESLSTRRKQTVRDVFERTVELEIAFFDAAFERPTEEYTQW